MNLLKLRRILWLLGYFLTFQLRVYIMSFLHLYILITEVTKRNAIFQNSVTLTKVIKLKCILGWVNLYCTWLGWVNLYCTCPWASHYVQWLISGQKMSTTFSADWGGVHSPFQRSHAEMYSKDITVCITIELF